MEWMLEDEYKCVTGFSQRSSCEAYKVPHVLPDSIWKVSKTVSDTQWGSIGFSSFPRFPCLLLRIEESQRSQTLY